MGVSIERLRGSASAFENFTFPRYRHLLDPLSTRTVAVAACSGLRPLGLALAEYAASKENAELLSLFVDGQDRRQGIGRALLRACENALAESGCKFVAAYHSNRLPGAPAFEATLRGCGWEAPKVSRVRSAGRCGALAAAIAEWPGVRRLLQNPDFSFASWSTVTDADDLAIERLSAEPTCVPNMSPNSWTGYIEPRASVAIRRRGTLVGWVLNRLHATDPEPILYCESAYIEHSLWRTAVLVAGYFHGYRMAAEHFGPDCVLHFFTGPRMPGMIALTRRRFAPVSMWVDDWLYSRKVLNGPA